MAQEVKKLTISNDVPLDSQLKTLIACGYEIVTMAVTESGGSSVFSQYADKVVVVVNRKENATS